MKHDTTETERAFAAGEFNSQERAMKFAHKIERERDELREVVQEAHDALENLLVAKRGGMQPVNALIDATSRANDVVKKLKPFLP